VLVAVFTGTTESGSVRMVQETTPNARDNAPTAAVVPGH